MGLAWMDLFWLVFGEIELMIIPERVVVGFADSSKEGISGGGKGGMGISLK